jgi:hypothetical protein
MNGDSVRDSFLRVLIPLAAVVGIAGCSAADPDPSLVQSGSTPVLTRAPDLTATVTMDTLQAGYTPEGYLSQYDVWVAIAPSTAADAGVVFGASTPVFTSTGGVLTRATAASIAVGDVIQIWHDATVAYGAVQAPPGAPAYSGTQVVVLR